MPGSHSVLQTRSTLEAKTLPRSRRPHRKQENGAHKHPCRFAKAVKPQGRAVLGKSPLFPAASSGQLAELRKRTVVGSIPTESASALPSLRMQSHSSLRRLFECKREGCAQEQVQPQRDQLPSCLGVTHCRSLQVSRSARSCSGTMHG